MDKGQRIRNKIMNNFWQDLRYGARTLLRKPGFTAIAILSLALGIGANTSIFSIVNSALLKPLPVEDPDRLVYIFGGTRNNPYSVCAYPEYIDYRDNNQVFSGLMAFGSISVSFGSDERADLINGQIVSGNYFDLLGVRASVGRTFLAEEDQTPNTHPVAVISHKFWQQRFGGQSDAVGQQVNLNGRSFTIIGITPAGFNGAQALETNDIYVPMMMQQVARPPRAGFSGEMNADLLSRRGNRWLQLTGRLKDDVTIEQAQSEISTIAARLEQAYPDTQQNRIATLFPVSKIDPVGYPQLLTVATLLLSVVGIVLVIACANVANLLLARATSRRKEIAIRLALGAKRSRLIRQLLTESTMLSLAGGALGLLLASWVVDLLKTTPPPAGMFAFTLDYSLDYRVLGFTFALSLITGILFGLAPALQASRPDLVPSLKDEAFVPEQSHRRFNLRNLLVIAQVALSLVLLVGAGLFLRSLRHTQGVDPGFDSDKILTATLNINLLRYTREQGQTFYQQIAERMKSLPGVESATLSRTVQMAGSGRTNSLMIEGRQPPDNVFRNEGTGNDSTSPLTVKTNVVGLDYFSTMGINLLNGRDFNQQDRDGSPAVVIVNETFARTHFPGDTALGKRLSFNGQRGPWLEIIGVVRDSKYRSLSELPTPFTYVPLAQNHETGMTLFVRTTGDPNSLAAAVRGEVQSLDRNLPVTDLQSMTTLIGDSLFAAKMGALLLGAFGLLALLLASVGLYGVMAYSVSRRTRELGIRMALGANRKDVIILVVGQGMKLSLMGVGIGLAISLALTKLLSSFLFGVSASDPVTYLLISLLLAAVALIACYIPARRATRVDPMIALRYE